MEYQQCFQCNNEVPFTASASSTKCLFCGAINEPIKFEVQPSKVKSEIRRNDDSLALGAVIGIIIGSDSGG
jgi:hypothetical protein